MNPGENEKAFRILMIEDNPYDIELTAEAFKSLKVPTILDMVKNGKDALLYLRRQGSFRSALRPDLILLDLNMPGRDGREVLREIKADPLLRRIPVLVLTSSEREEDIAEAYDLYANGYINKPFDFGQFLRVVRSVGEFWFTVAKLPSQ